MQVKVRIFDICFFFFLTYWQLKIDLKYFNEWINGKIVVQFVFEARLKVYHKLGKILKRYEI